MEEELPDAKEGQQVSFNPYTEKMMQMRREEKDLPDLDDLLELVNGMSSSMMDLETPEEQMKLFRETVASVGDEGSINVVLTAICFKLLEVDSDYDLAYLIQENILEKFLQVGYDCFLTGALWERRRNAPSKKKNLRARAQSRAKNALARHHHREYLRLPTRLQRCSGKRGSQCRTRR